MFSCNYSSSTSLGNTLLYSYILKDISLILAFFSFNSSSLLLYELFILVNQCFSLLFSTFRHQICYLYMERVLFKDYLSILKISIKLLVAALFEQVPELYSISVELISVSLYLSKSKTSFLSFLFSLTTLELFMVFTFYMRLKLARLFKFLKES